MSHSALAFKSRSSYAPGSFPMPYAPSVSLPDGSKIIPQHYLRYAQTLESLEEILQDIEFDAHTLLFAGADIDSAGLYLQVGMVGRENYERGNQIRPHKLVYGRKWRIESDTTNSEIVQTALLAIKKAREHEVRELFTLRPPGGLAISAALSNHQDIAVLQHQHEFLQPTGLNPNFTPELLAELLGTLQFGQRPITLQQIEQRASGQWIIDLQLGSAPLARMQEADLSEFDDLSISLILTQGTRSELIYTLMDQLIEHSNRYVEEHFRIGPFARFSRQYDPEKIARLSLISRPYARDAEDAHFTSIFKDSNYQVDAGRAAVLGTGILGIKNRKKIAAFKSLNGHMPKDLLA